MKNDKLQVDLAAVTYKQLCGWIQFYVTHDVTRGASFVTTCSDVQLVNYTNIWSKGTDSR